MPTDRPRIQVTVDDELAAALAAHPQAGRWSRSQTIRDLALRGAQAIAAEQHAQASATDVLLGVLEGSERFDLEPAAALHAAREQHLP